MSLLSYFDDVDIYFSTVLHIKYLHWMRTLQLLLLPVFGIHLNSVHFVFVPCGLFQPNDETLNTIPTKIMIIWKKWALEAVSISACRVVYQNQIGTGKIWIASKDGHLAQAHHSTTESPESHGGSELFILNNHPFTGLSQKLLVSPPHLHTLQIIYNQQWNSVFQLFEKEVIKGYINGPFQSSSFLVFCTRPTDVATRKYSGKERLIFITVPSLLPLLEH